MKLQTLAFLNTLAVAIFLFLFPSHGRAVLLDWNSQSWSSEALSRSFNLDNSNPGSDVSITITGHTSYFQNETPDDTTDLTGGQGSSQQSLFLNMNWANRNQAITITIDFNYTDGVDNVYFSVFDVDFDSGSYRDKLYDIVGIDADGNLVAPTITTSSGNELVGSGTDQYVRGTASVGTSSANGNVGIDFGSTTIYSVRFTYGNETNAPSNPGNQYIGLYDIGFTRASPKVPEVHPGLASSLVCFLVVGFRWVRARVRRKTPLSA